MYSEQELETVDLFSIFLNNLLLSGFEIEPYPLTEMLGEISSEIAIQGAFSQAPSATSNRPVQTSSPTGEELAKPMDSIQVKHEYHSENPVWLVPVP